jgi:hypothetical protein
VRDGVVCFSDSVEDITRALIKIPGIDQRIAQYVALRAFCKPDAFLTGMVLRRRAASNGATLTARALEARAEAWRPWRWGMRRFICGWDKLKGGWLWPGNAAVALAVVESLADAAHNPSR